ncbi:MAG: signal peptidase I [Anaerobacillus sp.]|uniref:signal peptidase I n=1 Tax=Anaerobacillus sp. TaxID=1872506 RepID=UPI00391C457B
MLRHKVIGEIFSWSKALLIALSIAIIVSAFIFQPFTVSGSSMEPTLDGEDPINKDKIGDRVLIYKSAYILGEEPKFNEIVIIDSRVNRKRTLKDNLLESPIVSLIIRTNDDEKKHWVKRVIGEAGDTIEFKDGSVYRNGTELVESYIKEEMILPFETIVVPENYIFVMGDNRNGSEDSRNVGPIPKENVLGKALLRYYPLNKINNF